MLLCVGSIEKRSHARRCVRDYIHVMDLAEGHVAALDKLFRSPDLGCVPINLGTGTGTTVLEMIDVRMRLFHFFFND